MPEYIYPVTYVVKLGIAMITIYQNKVSMSTPSKVRQTHTQTGGTEIDGATDRHYENVTYPHKYHN